MHALRTACHALLVAVLLLTSASFATARATPGPDGSLILCTGTGPVTVYIDEDGNPTEAPHLCPECVLTALSAPLPGQTTLHPPHSAQMLRFAELDEARITRAALPPQARGPPWTDVSPT